MRAKTVSLGQGPSVAKQCKDHLPVVRAGRARSVDLVDVGEIQIHIIHILDSLVVEFLLDPNSAAKVISTCAISSSLACSVRTRSRNAAEGTCSHAKLSKKNP